MVIVRKRLQSFVFALEADQKNQPSSRPDSLCAGQGQEQISATELTLRAFQVALEAVNYRILTVLKQERAVPLSKLAQVTALPELLISERVNHLAQIGLALQSMESDQVQATLLTDNLLGIIEAISAELAKKMRDGLPQVMEK